MRQEDKLIQHNLKAFADKFPEPDPEGEFDVRCASEYYV